MKITAIPGTHDWQVTALWYGATRNVFTGTVFKCLQFVSDHE